MCVCVCWGGGGRGAYLGGGIIKGRVPLFTPQPMNLIPFTDWAHNAHSVLFEQSKNGHYLPSLLRV